MGPKNTEPQFDVIVAKYKLITGCAVETLVPWPDLINRPWLSEHHGDGSARHALKVQAD